MGIRCSFVDLPKSYQKLSAKKRSWQGHQKDIVQTQGQAQDKTRTTRRHLKDKRRLTRTCEDKPRTDLRNAWDKKGLTKGSHQGKVQFYQFSIFSAEGIVCFGWHIYVMKLMQNFQSWSIEVVDVSLTMKKIYFVDWILFKN